MIYEDSSECPPGPGIIQAEPRPGMVELGPGYLDPALVPAALIRKWAADATDRWGARSLAYGANAGPWELRACLAARVPAGSSRCGPANVLTTGGTSAALDMLAARFAREGRAVLTEDPTYDLGRLIFTGRGAVTVPVPGPAADLDVSLLRRAVSQATRVSGLPPAIYLIPTFHNPTGRVLSARRRREVLELAHDTGAVIIEDQAYAELSYDGQPPPAPLWADSDDPERVVTLYSLAKCVAPGLRMGWLVGSERLVAELAAEPARLSGGGPNHFTATLIMAACLSGELDSHVALLRRELRARRDTLVSALAAELPAGFGLRRPAGGFFAWVSLPAGMADRELLDLAEQRGVSFAAGSRFGTSAQAARLCFAAAGPRELALGAARFLAACRPVPG
jgi:DNA-binding transcriptional MocR family regulator